MKIGALSIRSIEIQTYSAILLCYINAFTINLFTTFYIIEYGKII